MWFGIVYIGSRFAPSLPIFSCAQCTAKNELTRKIDCLFAYLFSMAANIQHAWPCLPQQLHGNAKWVRLAFVCFTQHQCQHKRKINFPEANNVNEIICAPGKTSHVVSHPNPFFPRRFTLRAISNHIYIGLCAIISLSILRWRTQQSISVLGQCTARSERRNHCCTGSARAHKNWLALFTCSQWIPIEWQTGDGNLLQAF